MLAVYYLIQWLVDVLAIYPQLGQSGADDGRGNWIGAFEHHFWQLVFALLVILLLSRGRLWEWGLSLRNLSLSLSILRRFCLYYGVFVVVGFAIQLLFGMSPVAERSLEPSDVAGSLAFVWLFAGISEEVLFRGLIHTYLARHWRGIWRWGEVEMPVAGFIATIIFTLAHVFFTLSPFAVIHLYPPQLLQAFVIGLYYSAVYHKTGSLLNPILAHNFSNGTLRLSEYLLLWIR